jgi:hypothetical protein
MRYIFSFLLLFVIFESVISAKSVKARMAVAAKALKMVMDRKRKLEATDVGTTDIEEGTASGDYNKTAPNEPESGDASANATTVEDDKPVSTQGTEIDKKTAAVQIMKFHSFNTVSRQINFGVFFYFRKRAIARMVIFRLRISYNSRLRNLAEDSVPSYCKIKNESLVGIIPPEDNPSNVDYDCNATALQDGTISNVTLNSDIGMQISKVQDGKEVYDNLDFTEVNFNGNSSQESQNLQQNTKVVSKAVSLKNTEASVEKATLKLTGEFDPSNTLSTGTTVPLTILTEKNGENTNIKYECTVKQTSPGELDCDTSSNPLKTTVQNLHLSAGTTSDNTLVTVYMKDSTNTTKITTTGGNRYTYNKSSSGLSGGAIAGIVIACVAVLLAASIAAIMLRKPAPPIDNTTVVGLKTVENI